MKSRHLSFILLIVGLGVCALVACAPETTTLPPTVLVSTDTLQPTPCNPMVINSSSGITKVSLPDGSEVYLSENTEVELTVAGSCPGVIDDIVVLLDGQVAIHSHLPVGTWFLVKDPGGNIAQLIDTGVVSFDPGSGLFLLECTNGNCELGRNFQQLTQLGCNTGGSLDQNGNFIESITIDINTLQTKYGDWIVPLCVATATPTPSNTPISSNSPTPSSTPTLIGTPNLKATATAACISFHSKFPQTPCP